MIYADFESILVPEDSRNHNPEVLHKQLSKTRCLQFWLQINVS